MRFFKMDPVAWRDGVKALTLAERGAYITILVEIYESERPVKLSERQWAKLMNCGKSRAHEHIETLIAAGKLYRNELGAIVNQRAKCEIKAVENSAIIKATARALRRGFARPGGQTARQGRRT